MGVLDVYAESRKSAEEASLTEETAEGEDMGEQAAEDEEEDEDDGEEIAAAEAEMEDDEGALLEDEVYSTISVVNLHACVRTPLGKAWTWRYSVAHPVEEAKASTDDATADDTDAADVEGGQSEGEAAGEGQQAEAQSQEASAGSDEPVESDMVVVPAKVEIVVSGYN